MKLVLIEISLCANFHEKQKTHKVRAIYIAQRGGPRQRFCISTYTDKNSNRFQIGPFSKVGTVLTLKENNHDCLFILFLMFEIVKYYLELKNNLEI